MANLHLLANRPSIGRLADVDRVVASSTDGDDARLDTLARLTRLTSALEAEQGVIQALDIRADRRPPVPPTPTTLQDLVRAGRRRLERERIGRRQARVNERLIAITRLQGALAV